MDAFSVMLKNVLIFVALSIPGFLLVKSKLLKSEQSGAFSKFVQYVGMPFLIISGTAGIEFTRKFTTSVLLMAGLLFVCIVVALVFSKPLTAREKDKRKQGMMRFCAVFSNCGFLAIPLAVAVFGTNSIVTAFVIVNNVLINLFMYTVGIYLVSGDKKAIGVKGLALNPVILAFIVGLIFNLTDIFGKLSEIADYCEDFSLTVTPLAMTILGMKLGEIEWKRLFTQKSVYYVSVLRLLVFPVAITGILLTCHFAFGLDKNVVLAIFVSISMPAATISSAFADTYGGDADGAAVYTLGSTVFSIATIPVLYWLLCVIL